MNLKRFTARTSREALALVREAFGDDAVVMSTKPCADGVEVLALAPESLKALEQLGARAATVSAPRPPAAVAAMARAASVQPSAAALDRDGRIEPRLDTAGLPADVAGDVERLQMSTLSFQDYVRQRMLKRRQSELAAAEAAAAAARPAEPRPAAPRAANVAPIEAARSRLAAQRRDAPAGASAGPSPATPNLAQVPVLRDEVRAAEVPSRELPLPPARGPQIEVPSLADHAAADALREQHAMLDELKSMRGLIEQRFGALAFMEKLQRQPRQAQLAQRLLETGFSPALIRKLVGGLPAALPEGLDEMAWAAGVLERNLPTGEREAPLEDAGGVFALIGATGVGKTTCTAKLAAAFAARHGAAQLGLITLDAYRVGAQEQLRTYGRILGVPVHTAHDRASLEDLLDLLAGKRMVLIDTAGMAQRDSRTRELLEMLSHRAIQRLLVVSAAAQGETIEDQLAAYAASGCRGVLLSKLDEAVKLAPALDSMIRHKLKVLAVANGQRVPEDWHRLSAQALVQHALKAAPAAAWKLDEGDVNLVFAGLPASTAAVAAPLGV